MRLMLAAIDGRPDSCIHVSLPSDTIRKRLLIRLQALNQNVEVPLGIVHEQNS